MSLSREEIIRMARGLGFRTEKKEGCPEEVVTDGEVITLRLCNLANAAYAAGANAEREACAKVCDSASDYMPGNLLRAGAIWCAFNIRARGN